MTRRLTGSMALVAALALSACATSESPGGSAAAPRTTPSAVPSGSPAAASGSGAATASAKPSAGELTFSTESFPVPAGSHPHDVAPAADGGIWYTAQRSGRLGWLDPATGGVREYTLGSGSAPHGVIVGPDGAPWITDSGLNAIVRVDPESGRVDVHRLPDSAPNANLNTAAFDSNGVLWFTGQRGFYGSLDPTTRSLRAFEAPRGAGPYGIAATPSGEVAYSSLAGSYLGLIDRRTGEVAVIDPPTAGAGLRRVWSDSVGRLWVSEWNAGQVGVYDPRDASWREWPLPDAAAQAYAVYVDETDAVWLTDFGANAIVRFDPASETFRSFPAEGGEAAVRQLLGRRGEVWGAESARDRLVVIRFGS